MDFNIVMGMNTQTDSLTLAPENSFTTPAAAAAHMHTLSGVCSNFCSQRICFPPAAVGGGEAQTFAGRR